MELEIFLFNKNREANNYSFNFLELFKIRKSINVLDEECQKCNLAYNCHPMQLIKDGPEITVFEKYCTKDFLKFGFIKPVNLT